MKKNFLYIIVVILLEISGSFLSVEEVQAESGAETTGFVYTIEYPENQQGDLGYFKLLMTPGQKQTVKIDLENLSSEELTIDVDLNTAKTNRNGVIEYGPNKLEAARSLKHNFTDIVKGPKNIKLLPKEEKKLELTINMPDESYEGVIVGGIQLKKRDKEDEKKANGATVINKYAYIVGMVLQQNKAEIEPEMELEKVYPGQDNYQNTIYIDLTNIRACFLNDLSLTTEITKKGSTDVLFESKKSAMRMAPNSKIKFPVTMGGERMIAGEYKAHVVATSGSQTWEWEEPFKITNRDADQFNENDKGLTQDKNQNWVLIIGLSIGLFLAIITSLAIRKKLEKVKN